MLPYEIDFGQGGVSRAISSVDGSNPKRLVSVEQQRGGEGRQMQRNRDARRDSELQGPCSPQPHAALRAWPALLGLAWLRFALIYLVLPCSNRYV